MFWKKKNPFHIHVDGAIRKRFVKINREIGTSSSNLSGMLKMILVN